MNDAQGYLSAAYAHSLAEWGEPVQLPRSRGWLLRRATPDGTASDATGCYPLFCCADWTTLAADLQEMEDKPVSVTVVADPLGVHGGEEPLRRAFPDLVRPFKEHFVSELDQPSRRFGSAQHRRLARRALETIRVETVEPSSGVLDEWVGLYGQLIERHAIRGPARFSRPAFERQFATPGLIVWRAIHEGETVGMTLWYRQENVAYYHLGAYNEIGYRQHASYALFHTALHAFADLGLALLVLGAGAGLQDQSSGLTQFKRGWATGTRTAYLCGRIGQPERYAKLCLQAGTTTNSFFPLYRSPTTECRF